MKTIQVFSRFLAAFLIVAAPGFAREKSNKVLAMEAQNPVVNLGQPSPAGQHDKTLVGH